MKRLFAVLSLSLALSANAQNLFSSSNKGEFPELTLSSGAPIADVETVTLESGKRYEMEITADGSAELAVSGAAFFRAIWINEIVINGIEIRPLGVDSIEFDEEGTAEIEFIAIRPGQYEFGVAGRGYQTLKIIIE